MTVKVARIKYVHFVQLGVVISNSFCIMQTPHVEQCKPHDVEPEVRGSVNGNPIERRIVNEIWRSKTMENPDNRSGLMIGTHAPARHQKIALGETPIISTRPDHIHINLTFNDATFCTRQRWRQVFDVLYFYMSLASSVS